MGVINLTGDSDFARTGVAFDAGAMVGMMGAMMQKRAADAKAAALKAQGESQARMYEMDATQEVAAAQRTSIERAAKNRQIEGTAKVIGASSGSTMTSATVVDVMGEMEGRDLYGRLSDLYQGDEKARRLKDSASLARYGADIGAAAARAQGTAAMIGGLQGAVKGFGKIGGSLTGGEDSGGSSWMDSGDDVSYGSDYGSFSPSFGDW